MEICSSTLGIFCPSDFLMCLWNCQWEESQTEKVLVSDPESHEEDKKHVVMTFTVTEQLQTWQQIYSKNVSMWGAGESIPASIWLQSQSKIWISIMKYPQPHLTHIIPLKFIFGRNSLQNVTQRRASWSVLSSSFLHHSIGKLTWLCCSGHCGCKVSWCLQRPGKKQIVEAFKIGVSLKLSLLI